MQDFNIFPTTLGVDSVDLKNYTKHIDNWIRDKKYLTNDKSPNLRHYQDVSILDHSNFKNLRNELLSKSNFYYKNILGFREDLYISDSWLNVCEKGGFQPDHYHTNCVVSGTLYISINENSPKLKFKNPRLLAYPTTPEIKCEVANSSPYNTLWISMGNLQNGSVIFWPSYLVHGYEQSESNDSRISISFNLNIKTTNFKYKNPFQLLWQ